MQIKTKVLNLFLRPFDKSHLSGETMIEIGLAISVFAIVALATVSLMSSGVNTSQRSLEITMARNEIDAQAEALRFIHSSSLAERKAAKDRHQYSPLWQKISEKVDNGGFTNKYGGIKTEFSLERCEHAYSGTKKEPEDNIFNDKAFVFNTRLLDLKKSTILEYSHFVNKIIIPAEKSNRYFIKSPLYPRIIYGNTYNSANSDSTSSQLIEKDKSNPNTRVDKVEGIWIVATRSESERNGKPEFYDFHIRTCWYSPGSSRPTTIGTIVRLYNPELTEDNI